MVRVFDVPRNRAVCRGLRVVPNVCGSANRNAKHFARLVCLDEPCVSKQLHDFSKRKMQKGIPPVFFEESKVFS
jgi:hypothetical protein